MVHISTKLRHSITPSAAASNNADTVSLPSGARVQTTPPEAVGPQRATSTSPLWTLESLRLEPDDAAANADREENHDPRGERHDEQSDDLTEEMRLENGSELARDIFTFAELVGAAMCSAFKCGSHDRWP